MELKHADSIVPDSSILYRQHYDHCITFISSALHSSHSTCLIYRNHIPDYHCHTQNVTEMSTIWLISPMVFQSILTEP